MDCDNTEDQRAVDELFDASAAYWHDVYGSDDFQGRIYQRRHDRALEWVGTLGDPPGSRALEVGCGAGHFAADLASLGYAVEATDSAEAMLDRARRTLAARTPPVRAELRIADAHDLPWPDATFTLVVALGVVPWLHSPAVAIAEMARVTRPGGHVVLSADNALGLSNLLEPRISALLGPVRRAIAGTLRALRLRGPRGLAERRYSPRRVDRMLAAAGLVRERSTTVGFGRFTCFGRTLCSQRRALRLDDRFQGLADRGRPLVRRMGNHYLVLARKS